MFFDNLADRSAPHGTLSAGPIEAAGAIILFSPSEKWPFKRPKILPKRGYQNV